MLIVDREFEMHENFYSLDVRIHHRIWDVQKHLLQALINRGKNTVWIDSMDLFISKMGENL